MNEMTKEARRVADILRDRAPRGDQFSLELVREAAADANVDLTRSLWDALASHYDTDRLMPVGVTDFLMLLVQSYAPGSVLNLWCRDGSMSERIAAALPEASVVGIDPSSKALDVARHFDVEKRIRWILGRPSEVSDELLGGSFDLLLSLAPFGLRSQPYSAETADGDVVRLNEEEGRIDLIHFTDAVAADGYAILLTASSILYADKSRKLLDVLDARGLHLCGAISLPADTFSPMTSIPTTVAIFGRSPGVGVYMAELPRTVSGQRQLIENMQLGRAGKSPETGVLVARDELTSMEALIARRDLERGLAATGIAPRPLGDVIIEVRRPVVHDGHWAFEECANSLLMPLAGFGPARVDLPEKVSRDWVQLVLDPEQAHAEYVAMWLSSPLGRRSREALASGNLVQRVKASSLGAIQIPLPSPDQQVTVLALDAQLEAMSIEAQQLREDLMAKPRRLDEIVRRVSKMSTEEDVSAWIESLPLPLSTVGRVYSARQDVRERIDALFNFFEAMAEFHATILLSGIAANEVYLEQAREELLGTLDERRRYYATTSLGGWTTMASRLGKELLRRYSSEHSDEREEVLRWFGSPDDAWLKMVTSKALFQELDEARRLRNDWKGHGGASGEAVNSDRLKRLEAVLGSIRAIVADRWDGARLIAPLTARQSNGTIQTTVDVLSGTSIPFLQETIITKDHLDCAYLYIIHGKGPAVMRLLPLVRMMSAPATSSTTCYFYNRIEGDEIRYISYYYEQEPETQVSMREDLSALTLAVLGLGGE